MDRNEDRLQFGENGAPMMNDSYFENLYDDLPKEIADLLKSSHPFMETDKEEETFEEKRARRAAMRKEAKASGRGKHASARGSFHFDEPVKEAEEVEEEAPVYEEPVEEPVVEVSLPEDEPKFEQATLKEVLDSIYPTEEPAEEEETVAKEPTFEQISFEETVEEAVAEEACEECECEEVPLEAPKMPVFDEEAILKKAMEATNIHIDEEEEEEVAEEEEEEEEDEEREEDYYDPSFKSREEERKEAFDRFYGEYDPDEGDERGGVIGKIIFGLLLIAAIAVAIFFGMKYMSVQSKLSAAASQSAQIESYKAENESLKLEMAALEDEIGRLEAEIVALKAAAEAPATEEEPEAETPAPAPAPAPATSTKYTVKDGDSYWSIASKIYGDGSKYQKILDANGLKESDELSIGQTLKIPN